MLCMYVCPEQGVGTENQESWTNKNRILKSTVAMIASDTINCPHQCQRIYSDYDERVFQKVKWK